MKKIRKSSDYLEGFYGEKIKYSFDDSGVFVLRSTNFKEGGQLSFENQAVLAIDEKTLPDTVVITHKNLNDGTLEGFTCPSLQVKAVQYHPEASPGPTDNLYLFTEFIAMMEGK